MFLCCLVGCRITPPDIGDPVEVSVIFQVTDFRTEIIVPPVEVGAASPEAAARKAAFSQWAPARSGSSGLLAVSGRQDHGQALRQGWVNGRRSEQK